jgi:lysophospholipase L1-like esterase
VICYGTSTTEGYGLSDPATESYPAQLAVLLGAAVESVVREGHSGVTGADLLANFSAWVTPHIQAGRRTILVLQELFNSIYNGASVATTMANFWAICDLAAAAGCDVIVQDYHDVDPAWGVEPNISTCEAAVEANWPAYADGFVRTEDFLFNYTDLSLYQADGLHLNVAGSGEVARLTSYEILRLLAGAAFVQTSPVASGAGGPSSTASVDVSPFASVAVAAVAGGPSSASSVILTVEAAVAALAGGPRSAAVVATFPETSGAVAAVAGGPTSGASVELTIVSTVAGIAGGPVSSAVAENEPFASVAVAAVAGGPTSSAAVSSPLHVAVSATAGGPVAAMIATNAQRVITAGDGRRFSGVITAGDSERT